MSGAHRIEVSTTSRAGCKNTECKKEGIKIQKGELRYGTFVVTEKFQSWVWKHWGCVTPKQISNLKDNIGDDPNQLDGYEELPEEFQEKIVKAVEQGHIDDEDWGWDIEMNREGKNGYFSPESKRRKKAEAQALKEESTEGDASPSKTDKKKRGRVKEDPDAEGAEIDEPPAKKTKTRTKKEPKIKNEDADGGSENEAPGTRKPKSTVKKEPKIKNEDAETGDENEAPATKKPKSRGKKEPKIKNEDAETGSENEGLANKKTKAATNKGKKASGNDADEDSKHDVQPIKKGRKQPKKARAADETALDVKDDSGDHDTLPPPKERKKRAPRQATMAKKVKDEDIETDGVEPASELETPLGKFELEHTSELEPEASEDVPKLQKGRKGASAISSKRQVKKAKKGTKSKTSPDVPSSNGRATRSRPA